jgi:hypothetical protein
MKKSIEHGRTLTMKKFAPMLLIGMAFVAGRTAIAYADDAPLGTVAPNKLKGTPAAAVMLGPDSLSAFTGRLDHVANGVGLRNSGSGIIRLRGAPAKAAPVSATLEFGFICTGDPCPVTVPVGFTATSTGASATLTGIRIAQAPQPCWFGTTYGAYSVAVPLNLISSPINDDYHVSGVPSFLKDGSDPWITPGSLPLAEGASLVVVYDDGGPPGVVYINDGAVMFSGTVTINNPLSPPILFGNTRKLTIIGADGQVGSSTFADGGTSGEKTFLGAGLTQIAGPGSAQNQDSDWNGNDGRPLNQLWDTSSHSFSDILSVGITTYPVQYQSFGDCMVWQAHVLTTR